MTFECSLDNEEYNPCGRGKSGQWTKNNVQDGQHNFRVKGTDGDGNVVVAEVKGWIVDTVSPTIKFTNAAPKTDASPFFSWTSSEQTKFQCSLDGGPYEDCGDGYQGEWRKDNIGKGSHVLSIVGTDRAGNQKSVKHPWTVGKILMRGGLILILKTIQLYLSFIYTLLFINTIFYKFRNTSDCDNVYPCFATLQPFTFV